MCRPVRRRVPDGGFAPENVSDPSRNPRTTEPGTMVVLSPASSVSQQPHLLEAGMAAAGDDDVVVQRDPETGADVAQLVGHPDVGLYEPNVVKAVFECVA